jgi:hypothetical protein
MVLRKCASTVAGALAAAIVAAPAGAGFAGSDVFLPMAGRQAGVHPSNWYTTVWVHNPGGEAATARVYFLERGTANPSPPWVDVSVGPGATERLDNVVETYFHAQAFGALRVTCAGAKLVVTSRVYSKAVGEGEADSVGQDFAGVPASFAIGLGERTQLLGAHQTVPTAGSEYRYNFGVVETTGHSAWVRVRALDEVGAELGLTEFQVREWSQRQVAFKDHFPGVSTDNARLEVEVIAGGGKVIAYGSQIANGSQDPTTFEMTYAEREQAPVAVQHDATLVGDGTAAAPLGLADGAVSLAKVKASGAGAEKVLTTNGTELTWEDDGLRLPFAGSVGFAGIALDVANAGGTAIRGTAAESVGVLGTAGGDMAVPLFSPVGVLGTSPAGIGVSGHSGSAHGVFGESSSGFGVHGASGEPYTSGTAVASAGVAGASKNRVGVFGVSRTAAGVVGASLDAAGVDGSSQGAPGVTGTSLNRPGVSGTSTNSSGLYGSGWIGVEGESTGGHGGYFTGGGSAGVGVYACGAADAAPDVELGDRGGDDGRIYSARTSSGSDIGLHSMDRVWIDLDDDNNSTGSFFQIRSGADDEIFKVEEDGDVRVPHLGGGGTRDLCIDTSGFLAWCPAAPSDARLKTGVVPLAAEIDVLAGLSRLQGVRYFWDTAQPRVAELGSRRELGLLAQDVEAVLPEVVSYDAEGYRSLDYSRLTAFLVEVAKAQQRLIERQEGAIRDLLVRVAAIEEGAPSPPARTDGGAGR